MFSKNNKKKARKRTPRSGNTPGRGLGSQTSPQTHVPTRIHTSLATDDAGPRYCLQLSGRTRKRIMTTTETDDRGCLQRKRLHCIVCLYSREGEDEKRYSCCGSCCGLVRHHTPCFGGVQRHLSAASRTVTERSTCREKIGPGAFSKVPTTRSKNENEKRNAAPCRTELSKYFEGWRTFLSLFLACEIRDRQATMPTTSTHVRVIFEIS